MIQAQSPAADSDALLQARAISKSFPGVKALDGVGITVKRGRLLALLGENGAGKSTLMNILSGVFPPDAGDITLAGRPVSFRSPREAQEAGIAMIHQELNLISDLSVAENIFLGREPLTRFGLIDYREMHRNARALLAQLRLDVDPSTPVARLRIGAQQVVEIAKALSFRSSIIIMDEPTSALSEQEVAVLFGLIEQLKKQGLGLIYITHKLDELPRIADDVTVLRDGRLIGSMPIQSATREEMVRMMVGRDIAERLPKRAFAPGDEVLNVERLSLRSSEPNADYTVKDISFSVRRGEVLGIYGLMGAGRTELLEAIYGLHPRMTTGKVSIDGQPADLRSPQQSIAAGLALAPEDRKAEGLVLSMSVAENTSLAALSKTSRFGLLSATQEHSLVSSYVGRLRVKTPSLRARVNQLSGGNQQKVVLAKWLATRLKVLLLDEPTRGIDVHAKKEIYELIEDLAREGLAIVMVSSELPELLAVADRILVLRQGRQTQEFRPAETTEEAILHAALPAVDI